MIKRLVWTAAVAATVYAPAARADDFKNFDFICTSGSFVVCASIHLKTYQVGTQWKLEMEVWNLAGAAGIQYNLHALGLRHVDPAGWTGTYSLASVIHGASNITTSWKVPGNAVNGGGVEVEASTQTKQGSDGIIGCGDPPSGGGTKWQTCFPSGDPVVFTFNTSIEFALNNPPGSADAEVRWHATQLPDGSSLKCDTGIPDGDGGSFAPCTVVPEPVTMALLGTGLAGVGAVGLIRRRRKRDWDTESA